LQERLTSINQEPCQEALDKFKFFYNYANNLKIISYQIYTSIVHMLLSQCLTYVCTECKLSMELTNTFESQRFDIDNLYSIQTYVRHWESNMCAIPVNPIKNYFLIIWVIVENLSKASWHGSWFIEINRSAVNFKIFVLLFNYINYLII